MPTPLIESYHKKFGLSIAKLEKLWEEAKVIAKKSSKSKTLGYGLVTTIFKNKVGLAASQKKGRRVSVSKVAIDLEHDPEWFKLLPKDEQEAYLKAHPKSKIHALLQAEKDKGGDKAVAEPEVKEEDKGPTDEDHVAVEEMNKVADENKDREPSNPDPKQRSLVRNLFAAGSKAVKSLYSGVRSSIHGSISDANQSLQDYADGVKRERSPEEQAAHEERAKKVKSIMGAIFKVALVAAIGAGVFMLAPTVAPALAEYYFNARNRMSSMSSEVGILLASDEEQPMPTNVMDLAKDISYWLSTQDIPKLMEQIEKAKK